MVSETATQPTDPILRKRALGPRRRSWIACVASLAHVRGIAPKVTPIEFGEDRAAGTRHAAVAETFFQPVRDTRDGRAQGLGDRLQIVVTERLDCHVHVCKRAF
jgi:hypothetical protein